MGETGVAWITVPGSQPVYAVVDGGVVTACTPYVESWMLGRTAAQLRDRLARAQVEWIPLSTAPRLVVPHLVDKTRIRRWRGSRPPLAEIYLTFGQADGGWYVESTDEPLAWIYGVAAEAWAECLRRMRGGQWERVPASYGPQGERRAIDDDPALPAGLTDPG